MFSREFYRKSSEYHIWAGIKQRCTNKKNSAYHNYGGRGITMCERWINSFSNFYEDMGKRPTELHSIDRIDNNKGYSPENCRWVTRSVQNNNTRANLEIEFEGKKYTAKQFCDFIGITNPSDVKKIRRWFNQYKDINKCLQMYHHCKDDNLCNNNKTGVTGVCWDKNRKRYIVGIMVNGKKYNLGRFKLFEDAVKARKDAEKKYR